MCVRAASCVVRVCGRYKRKREKERERDGEISFARSFRTRRDSATTCNVFADKTLSRRIRIGVDTKELLELYICMSLIG